MEQFPSKDSSQLKFKMNYWISTKNTHQSSDHMSEGRRCELLHWGSFASAWNPGCFRQNISPSMSDWQLSVKPMWSVSGCDTDTKRTHTGCVRVDVWFWLKFKMYLSGSHGNTNASACEDGFFLIHQRQDHTVTQFWLFVSLHDFWYGSDFCPGLNL